MSESVMPNDLLGFSEKEHRQRMRALKTVACVSSIALMAIASPRSAHAQWKEIGKTVIGNPVFVLNKSVSKAKDGIITATVRATLVRPVKTAKGELKASKTVVMIDCARHLIAVKENTYYFDEGMTKVYEKTAPKLPGFSSPFKGSLPEVAMGYLCLP